MLLLLLPLAEDLMDLSIQKNSTSTGGENSKLVKFERGIDIT